VIPSILRSRIESRWIRHWILGYVYEYRAILETSAGQDLVTEWTSSESVAQMDGARLALSLREPVLLVA
jgi:hypothetical protein